MPFGVAPASAETHLALTAASTGATAATLVPAIAGQRGVVIEVVVEPAANVAEAILRQAEQFGAHAICLSSHGRTGLRSAVFGSVAGDVVVELGGMPVRDMTSYMTALSAFSKGQKAKVVFVRDGERLAKDVVF